MKSHGFRRSFVVAFVGLVACVGQSLAAPTSTVSWAMTGTDEGDYPNVVRVLDSQVDATGRAVYADVFQSSDYGERTGWAAANLSDGTLRAYAAASGNSGPGTVNQYSVARFGDTFSTVDDIGASYSWTASDSGVFTFAVTGADEILGSASASAWLRLYVFSPNALDDTGALPGSPLQWFSWGLTETTTRDLDPRTWASVSIETLASGDVVTAAVNTGPGFSWMLELTLAIGIASGDPSAAATLDFAHTIAASYAGPDGTRTISGSGVFPGTDLADSGSGNAVPEPVSLALLGIGLMCLCVVRRRPVL